MIQARSLEGCLNPNKMHLYRLPSLEKATPAYESTSKEGILIFPMFQTREGDISLEHHIVRSGCWARRSWLLYSDLIPLGIPAKFYIEMREKDRILPILKESHVDVDNDVLYFDGTSFEQTEYVHLGKKLAFANDKQFKEYDWVWQMDTDNFLASPRREQYPFFEREKSRLHPRDTISDLHWWWFLLDTDDREVKMNEWRRRAKLLIDVNLVDKYDKNGPDKWAVGGGVYALPAKAYHANQPDDLEWLTQAGQIMQDDEAVFSLWLMRDKPCYSIETELGMSIVNIAENARVFNEIGHPYMSHVGSFAYEYEWRKGIDAL